MRWQGFLSILLLSPLAAGAAEEPLSLQAAVEQALQIAPQVSARAASVDAAQSLVTSAGRLPDPELIIGVDNLPVTGADAYSTTSDFMTMRKVGVMQEFPRARKRRLEHDLAEAEAGVASAELVQARLEIARDVATAWIWRSTAERSLEELRALEPEVALQAAAARAAVSAGRSSTAEALAAEATVAQLANRIIKMRGEARQAAYELSSWVDVEPTRPLGAMPSLDELPTPATALLASVHEHGAVLPYESRIAAARVDVDLARAARRPDWSAELAFAKRGPEFSDMVSLQFRIGLPLFTRNRQDPIVSAKHAELRRIESERADEVRMHRAELGKMITEWEVLGEQLKQYEKELLPLARERSRAALASYRAGRGDLRLALDAYEQEIDFVIEHAELQNERGRAWAFLRYLGPQHLHP
jgi:outer membrane protein TolC